MTPAHVRMMVAYGAWTNGWMLDPCGGLSDVHRKRNMGAFFKLIPGTFDHLISEASPGWAASPAD